VSPAVQCEADVRVNPLVVAAAWTSKIVVSSLAVQAGATDGEMAHVTEPVVAVLPVPTVILPPPGPLAELIDGEVPKPVSPVGAPYVKIPCWNVFLPVHGFAFARYAITELTPSITPATMLKAPEGPTDNPELPTHVRTPAETEHVELSGLMTPTVELVALLTLMALPEMTMGGVPVYVVPA
jgi:hypothetical protein